MSNKFHYRVCGWTALFVITVAVGELYLHHSAPYRAARSFIESSTTVRQEIGAVRSASGWEGTVHYSGNSGWASFRMNVRGSRADGVVDITLRCHGGAWSVDTGRLYVDSGPAVMITQQLQPTNSSHIPPG
jgi:hypothetical protein